MTRAEALPEVRPEALPAAAGAPVRAPARSVTRPTSVRCGLTVYTGDRQAGDMRYELLLYRRGLPS